MVDFVAPAASWHALLLLSALSWRLLCYFLPSWHVLGPIFCHFGRPRPPKKHEFPREGRQNHAFRCIRVGCRVWTLLGRFLASLGGLWGTSCVSLGASWAPLGGILGTSWRLPGGFLAVSWGFLAESWVSGPPGSFLGGLPGRPGRLLGSSWWSPGDFLGTFWNLPVDLLPPSSLPSKLPSILAS
jgi:hypothetical protein